MTDTEKEVLCARIDELCAANERMRDLVRNMWPVFIGIKRVTFADRLHAKHEIDELGIELGIVADYYDWRSMLDRNADVTVVIGARGSGMKYERMKHGSDIDADSRPSLEGELE